MIAMDFGRKVASHETTEVLNAKIAESENQIFEMQELLAKGNFSKDDLGHAWSSFNAAHRSLGTIYGWDERTVARKTSEALGKAVVKGSAAIGNTRPTYALGVLQVFKDHITEAERLVAESSLVGKQQEFLEQEAISIYLNAGPEKADEFLNKFGRVGEEGSGWRQLSQSNNPGNIKNADGTFAQYETPADGLNSIAGRFIRYQESDKFGKAQTVLQALRIYAPKGDGKNDPDAYSAFVKQETGIDPNQAINFRENPEALAKITRAVVIYENGKKATDNGNIYTQEQYAQAAKDAIAGKKPRLSDKGGTVADAGTSSSGRTGYHPNDLLLKPSTVKKLRGMFATETLRREKAASDQLKNEIVKKALASDDPHVVLEDVANNPALKKHPEIQKAAFDAVNAVIKQKKQVAEYNAQKQVDDAYGKMRELRDGGKKDIKDYMPLVLSIPPDKQSAALSQAKRYIEGDLVDTDPKVFTELVRRIGRGDGFLSIAAYADRLSLTDQHNLSDPQRAKTLAGIQPYFEQEAARAGLGNETQGVEKGFVAFQHFIPQGGFKNQKEAEDAIKRALQHIVLDKNWAFAKTVRGYESKNLAKEGYYPSAGAELDRFKAELAKQGYDLDRMSEEEKSDAYKVMLGVR